MSGRTGTQVVRFLVVGALAAIVDYLTYRLLLETGMSVSPAKAAGFVVATALAYAVNRRWTFGAHHSMRRVLRFLGVYAVTLLVNLGINEAALAALVGNPGAITWSWMLAQATASALNFIAMRHYVFAGRT